MIAVDMTPAGAAVDQGRVPLYVVRALVPGLIPIWFGHGMQPAGLPAFAATQLSRGGARAPSDASFIHPFT